MKSSRVKLIRKMAGVLSNFNIKKRSDFIGSFVEFGGKNTYSTEKGIEKRGIVEFLTPVEVFYGDNKQL